ncbi:MAG: allophanate hydrolase [Gammaproteobacteria bacterium]
MDLSISALHDAYRSGELTPEEVVEFILQSCEQYSEHNIWITLLTRQQIDNYLKQLENQTIESMPLYGVPFVIKDNIDLAGIPTTAACPYYEYIPGQNAFVVQQLLEAGAIPIGKTNMDQFATGLVGTRSPEPWGACRNAFNKEYISGGSSSGSAVAVALGLASFSLGTDTAGSGRVPAAFNNLVGLKPSKGLLSTRGVIPACRSLDCVSIFALNADDANKVLEHTAVFDSDDDYARQNCFSNNHRHYGTTKKRFRFAVPKPEQLNFFGNEETKKLFAESCKKLVQLGGEQVEIDFSPFLETARLLYEGPWVTERYVAIEELINSNPESLLPVINSIIGGGKQKMASDAFKALYQLQHYKRITDAILDTVDILVTPTAGTIYTVDEVNADPIQLNSNIGYYTNYMNLLDYSAVAVPAGFMKNGIPFGITLTAAAFEDRKLLSFAQLWQASCGYKMGNTSYDYCKPDKNISRVHQGFVDLVVCGAHLQGFPLNWQLTERGAEFIKSSYTSANYKLYALAEDGIKRPGMVRDSENGKKIIVEVWRLPVEQLGSFVNDITAPLGIGKVELESGEWLSGFICEPYVIESAVDISEHGGWSAYCASA